MIGSIDEAIAKIAMLDSAIDSALETEVADAARKCIAWSAENNVYTAYTPKVLYSRRGSAGGLTAEANIQATAGGKELTVRNITGLQNLYSDTWQENLTNLVESGSYSFHMQLAGARPFMDEAKELLMSGPGQQALHAGLARQGIILD